MRPDVETGTAESWKVVARVRWLYCPTGLIRFDECRGKGVLLARHCTYAEALAKAKAYNDETHPGKLGKIAEPELE